MDLQVRLVSADKRLELQAYVKNLIDENNIVSSIIEDGLIGSYRNVRLPEPRTMVVSVLARFKVVARGPGHTKSWPMLAPARSDVQSASEPGSAV